MCSLPAAASHSPHPLLALPCPCTTSPRRAPEGCILTGYKRTSSNLSSMPTPLQAQTYLSIPSSPCLCPRPSASTLPSFLPSLRRHSHDNPQEEFAPIRRAKTIAPYPQILFSLHLAHPLAKNPAAAHCPVYDGFYSGSYVPHLRNRIGPITTHQ